MTIDLTAPVTDDLDERILDAALAEFETYGLRRVSAEDVAKRARVGRATIYRRFGSKDRLLQTVILRETRRFLTRLADATHDCTTPEEALTEAFVIGLRTARELPLLSRVLQNEPELFLPQLSAGGGVVMRAARDIVAERLGAASGTGADFTVAAEVLLRVALSLLLVPDASGLALDDDSARAFARDYLTRILHPLPPPPA